MDPQVVQRTLLSFNDGLAKQKLTDVPRKTLPWQAAEFALVHGWIQASPSGFDPTEKITRGESANILVNTFQLMGPPAIFQRRVQALNYDGPPTIHATFQDVPLYSVYGTAVEALIASHAVYHCAKSEANYCPADAETVEDFVHSLTVLSKSNPQLSNTGTSQLQMPLTRIKAALLLYQFMNPKNTSHPGK